MIWATWRTRLRRWWTSLRATRLHPRPAPAPFRHRGKRERVWCEDCEQRVTLTPSGAVRKHQCQSSEGQDSAYTIMADGRICQNSPPASLQAPQAAQWDFEPTPMAEVQAIIDLVTEGPQEPMEGLS